jgi:serine/threonine protein kinase
MRENPSSIDFRYMLIDLDASAEIGRKVSAKYSSAYSPPEMATYLISRFKGDGDSERYLPIADPSFDIWGFGAVLYELCSGNALFPDKDVSDDNLFRKDSLMHLANWLCLDEEKISGILLLSNLKSDLQADAAHLIWWCLQRNPKDRPTIEQLKSHPFFRNSFSQEVVIPQKCPPPLKTKYHFYLSHLEESSDIVNSLYFYFQEYSCKVFINGNTSAKTMRNEIEKSEVFVFFLTSNVLYRPNSLYELFQVSG